MINVVATRRRSAWMASGQLAGALLAFFGVVLAMWVWRWDWGLSMPVIAGLSWLLISTEYQPAGLLGLWCVPILFGIVSIMAGHEAGASFLAMTICAGANFVGGALLGLSGQAAERKQRHPERARRFTVV